MHDPSLVRQSWHFDRHRRESLAHRTRTHQLVPKAAGRVRTKRALERRTRPRIDSARCANDTTPVCCQETRRTGKNDPRIVRLRTIPGIGPRTAEILVAFIDDPHRFENGRQVAAYFGLVPRQFQSGETDRNGRITKRGNPLARTILVECAWASLKYNPWAKGIYDRICGKQKTRKKKAAVALARKIAVLAWAMLRDEKDWDPKTMIDITEAYGRMTIPKDVIAR